MLASDPTTTPVEKSSVFSQQTAPKSTPLISEIKLLPANTTPKEPEHAEFSSADSSDDGEPTFFENGVAKLALAIVTQLIVGDAVLSPKGFNPQEFLNWMIDDTMKAIRATTPRCNRRDFDFAEDQ